MDDLTDLHRDLTDALDLLGQSVSLAYRLSGDEPGRAPAEWTERLDCPDCGGSGFGCVACDARGYFDVIQSDPGEPASPGWAAMVRLSNAIGQAAGLLDLAMKDPEIRSAFEAAEEEARENDREPIQLGDYHYYEKR